jgi:hypothetical protein
MVVTARVCSFNEHMLVSVMSVVSFYHHQSKRVFVLCV